MLDLCWQTSIVRCKLTRALCRPCYTVTIKWRNTKGMDQRSEGSPTSEPVDNVMYNDRLAKVRVVNVKNFMNADKQTKLPNRACTVLTNGETSACIALRWILPSPDHEALSKPTLENDKGHRKQLSTIRYRETIWKTVNVMRILTRTCNPIQGRQSAEAHMDARRMNFRHMTFSQSANWNGT